MKIYKLITLSFYLLTTHIVIAQSSSEKHTVGNDYMFPSKGKLSLLLATGIPYVGLAELDYGITNRFTIGGLIGKNPVGGLYAVGIRVRRKLFAAGNTRMHIEIPVILYPQTKSLEAWMLIYPHLMIEKKLHSGILISAGAGLPIGACVDEVFGESEMPHHHLENQTSISHSDKESVFTSDGGFMGGAWYTLNTSIGIPVGKRMVFQQRFDFILGGIESGNIYKKQWFYNVPVIMITGITISL